MISTADPLWVITTYYNPANYKRRRENFRAFRRSLNAPLMVVELARPGEHQLTKDDGDIVLSLTGEDRIWQKERLLNIGVAELPPHVDYVAWIDCDVIFEDEDWASKAVRKMSRNNGILQPFETSVHLPPSVDAAGFSRRDCRQQAPLMKGVSIASALAMGAFDLNEVKLDLAKAAPESIQQYRQSDRHNCYGMAWVAQRATIEKIGFYDRNIVGGGDSLLVYSALGRLEDYWTMRVHTAAHKTDSFEWKQSADASGLFSHIDCLESKLYHMWHGSIEDRRYRSRYEILSRNDFAPRRDIGLSANGSWQWVDPDGVLAKEVGAYFFSRQEDGDCA